jgi:hypothetical protein
MQILWRLPGSGEDTSGAFKSHATRMKVPLYANTSGVLKLTLALGSHQPAEAECKSQVASKSAKKRKRSHKDSSDGLTKGSIDSTLSQDARHYFPAALQHMFGPLPLPRARPSMTLAFPHNVIFVASDWVVNGCHLDTPGYDVVLA